MEKYVYTQPKSCISDRMLSEAASLLNHTYHAQRPKHTLQPFKAEWDVFSQHTHAHISIKKKKIHTFEVPQVEKEIHAGKQKGKDRKYKLS